MVELICRLGLVQIRPGNPAPEGLAYPLASRKASGRYRRGFQRLSGEDEKDHLSVRAKSGSKIGYKSKRVKHFLIRPRTRRAYFERFERQSAPAKGARLFASF
jgi:hypothetical protein